MNNWVFPAPLVAQSGVRAEACRVQLPLQHVGGVPEEVVEDVPVVVAVVVPDEARLSLQISIQYHEVQLYLPHLSLSLHVLIT